MNLRRSFERRILARFLVFAGWTSVFAVIYAQSPLYTSNQNQYFLHGLANANYGFLKSDWLANTVDPTPLFSILVSLTYSAFHTDILFYAYYAILLGIYLYCLLGICSLLFDLVHPSVRFVYLTSILIIHSAGLRFFLSRAIGPEWTYLLEGGLAGQRVLGVVFQPSAFGVLILVSIFLFCKGYSYVSILPLALAVSFHPTYLLSAGIVTLAYMLESYRESRNLIKSVSLGALAFLLASPTIFYLLTVFGPNQPEITAQARDILVYVRIPHHAVISEWFDLTSMIKIGLILVAIYLVRGTRLFLIMAVSFMVAGLLTILQAITQDESLALLFPWRISSILVPLSVAILSAVLVRKAFNRFSFLENGQRRGLELSCSILILLATLVGLTRTVLERQMIQASQEREFMNHAKVEKGPGDVYLTPTKMQDFRLITGAPVYIDFKSIPYQDGEILEWYRRIQLANDFYERSKVNCELVSVFAAEGVTHIIVDINELPNPCNNTRLEYLDEQYGIYSITR